MNLHHKLPLIGYSIGVFWIIASTIRWFFLYPDWSQLLFAWALGLGIIYCAYVLNWMKNKDIRDETETKRLDSIVDWWMKTPKRPDGTYADEKREDI